MTIICMLGALSDHEDGCCHQLFFINLFVGVIYEKYYARRHAGITELNREQRTFLKIVQTMSSPQFSPQRRLINHSELHNNLRSTCYNIVTSTLFEHVILTAIVANVLVMAATFHGEPKWWEDTQVRALTYCLRVLTTGADRGCIAVML